MAGMKIEFLRHATLVVSLAGTRILVDPMLGPAGEMPPIPETPNPRRNPLVPLPGTIDAIVAGVEAALVTHMHRDHFDAVAGEILPKGLPLLVQAEDEGRLREMGFTEVLRVDPSRAWRGIEMSGAGPLPRCRLARRKLSGRSPGWTSTQAPSAMICPVSSASVMNWSGFIMPHCGCGHRTSASTPASCPLPRSPIGW